MAVSNGPKHLRPYVVMALYSYRCKLVWAYTVTAIYSLWRYIVMAYIVMARAVVDEVAHCVRLTASATSLRDQI